MMIPNHHPINRDGLVLWLDYKNTGSVAATGTWEDYSGNGNDGTLVGDAYVDSGGLHLDGAGDYVEVADDASLDIQVTDGITIGAWINPNSLVASDSFTNTNPKNIINKYDNINFMHFTFRIVGEKLNFAWRNSANTSYNSKLMDSHTLNNNEWQYVTAVHSGTDVNFYINGNLQASSVSVGSMTDVSTPNNDRLRIGVYYNGGSPQRNFNGQIDKVMIFNRALSTGEIQTMYQRTLRA